MKAIMLKEYGSSDNSELTESKGIIFIR